MCDSVFIYQLTDPNTQQVRYVGKTIDIVERMKKHKRDALSPNGTRYHRNAWLKSLYNNGEEPIVDIIKEVTLDNWQYWERKFIRQLKEAGHPLTNMTDGGEGIVMRGENHPNFGKQQAPTTREKISKKAKERWDNGEYDSIRHASLEEKWGKNAAEKHRKRMVEYNKTKTVSSKTKEKISKVNSRPILLLNDNNDIVYEFANAQKAANALGCGRSNVNNCRRFGQKLLRKYTVVYKDEYKILQVPED